MPTTENTPQPLSTVQPKSQMLFFIFIGAGILLLLVGLGLAVWLKFQPTGPNTNGVVTHDGVTYNVGSIDAIGLKMIYPNTWIQILPTATEAKHATQAGEYRIVYTDMPNYKGHGLFGVEVFANDIYPPEERDNLVFNLIDVTVNLKVDRSTFNVFVPYKGSNKNIPSTAMVASFKYTNLGGEEDQAKVIKFSTKKYTYYISELIDIKPKGIADLPILQYIEDNLVVNSHI